VPSVACADDSSPQAGTCCPLLYGSRAWRRCRQDRDLPVFAVSLWYWLCSGPATPRAPGARVAATSAAASPRALDGLSARLTKPAQCGESSPHRDDHRAGTVKARTAHSQVDSVRGTPYFSTQSNAQTLTWSRPRAAAISGRIGDIPRGAAFAKPHATPPRNRGREGALRMAVRMMVDVIVAAGRYLSYLIRRGMTML
jgi:hypothetical protein